MKNGRVDVIQMVYSILRQGHYDVINEAHQQGVGIVARTALESGLLTGKYLPGHQFSSHDQRTRYKKENFEFNLEKTQELKQFVIKAPYENLSQVAIHFCLAHEGISSLLIGARTVEQMKMNMKTAELPSLDKDLVKRLRDQYGNVTEKANFA